MAPIPPSRIFSRISYLPSMCSSRSAKATPPSRGVGRSELLGERSQSILRPDRRASGSANSKIISVHILTGTSPRVAGWKVRRRAAARAVSLKPRSGGVPLAHHRFDHLAPLVHQEIQPDVDVEPLARARRPDSCSAAGREESAAPRRARAGRPPPAPPARAAAAASARPSEPARAGGPRRLGAASAPRLGAGRRRRVSDPARASISPRRAPAPAPRSPRSPRSAASRPWAPAGPR